MKSPKNELKIYRRHTVSCDKTSFTFEPQTKQEQKADTCECPICASGYLALELDAAGKQKRIFNLSLGTNKWNQAAIEKADLLRRQRIEEEKPKAAATISTKNATVADSVKRFLEARGPASMNPIEHTTFLKYRVLLNQRLIPFCKENEIETVAAFEESEPCRLFSESWRQMRRSVGEPLGLGTRKIEMQRFRSFLNFCVETKRMKKNGAKAIKIKGRVDKRRYGLELHEYQRVLDVLESKETRVAIELMRWCGLRISDCQKFRKSELVRNLSGDGYNADFIQRKTKQRCLVPVPPHVVAQLRALPVTTTGNFFTCSLGVLSDRINTVFQKAQAVSIKGVIRDRKFRHHVSPHCLRHTFAIQHLNAGVDIAMVSKWLGHESVAVTAAHYRNYLESSKMISENASRESVERQLKMMALPA